MDSIQKHLRNHAGTLSRKRRLLITLAFVVTPTIGHADSSVSYGYDQVGRIATAAYDSGLCVTYIYDTNGNRTAQSYTMYSGPTSQNWGSGVWGCYLKWTPH